jgi:hypothetical protein
MDSQGNPQDRDVWGNSPSDAWGRVEDTNAHGNAPQDVFGNYAGNAPHDTLGDAVGDHHGGLIEAAIDFFGSLFGG